MNLFALNTLNVLYLVEKRWIHPILPLKKQTNKWSDDCQMNWKDCSSHSNVATTIKCEIPNHILQALIHDRIGNMSHCFTIWRKMKTKHFCHIQVTLFLEEQSFPITDIAEIEHITIEHIAFIHYTLKCLHKRNEIIIVWWKVPQ